MLPAVVLRRVECCNSAACCAEHALCTIIWSLAMRWQDMRQCAGKVQYLVKWKGLGYDESTWESPADLLPKFTAELARFQDQHPVTNELDHRKRSHAQVRSHSSTAFFLKFALQPSSCHLLCLSHISWLPVAVHTERCIARGLQRDTGACINICI